MLIGNMNLRTVCVLIGAIWLAACSSTEPIVVGTGNTTEQQILGEIVAQHLENRMSAPVEKRLAMGTTRTLFGAMQTRELSLFTDYTSQIVSEILEEQPGSDTDITLQRARGEMRRLSQMAVSDPLGFDARYEAIIPDSFEAPIYTLSEAAEWEPGWSLGVSRAFQTSDIGLRRLNDYRLPLSAATRAVELTDLFPFMEANQFTMVVAPTSSGWLLQDKWRELADDKVVMPPMQAVVVTRQEAFDMHPGMEAVIDELTGKVTLEKMRAMNAAVDIDEREPGEVAAEFLRENGLN